MSGWQAAPSRTIVLEPNQPLRGLGEAPARLVWPAKASADQIDYAVDPTAILAEEGDALVGASATVTTPGTPTDLALLWCSIIDGAVVLLTGGGAPGTTIPVAVSIVTAAGRRRLELIRIPVSEDSPATAPLPVPVLASGIPVPPNAILVDAGVLIAPDGRPYLAG